MRVVGVCVAVLLGALPASASALEIEVLSSRADLVSGGDALVRISGEGADGAKVTLGERDVSGQFARRANGHVEALLTGIPDARVELRAENGGQGAKLTLTGHPNGGPLISGPQMQPWICQATAQDAQCNEPAKYELLAKTKWSSELKPYDPANPPSDLAEATTTEGEKVPFIVRQETGYQDRDQYRIATLYDPEKPWEPWDPQRSWNGRLVFTHGGSCGTDRGAGGAPDVLNTELLGKGFIVASTALNNLGHNCNPVLIAESELMARERVIEQHGPVTATLGTGCSGGSIAQLMVAHAYPGFYDGITVSCTFADLFTTGKHAVSGHLFKTFFGKLDPKLYTPIDHAAVNGSPVATLDDFLFDLAFWPAIDGSGGCGGLPESYARWSPENPAGVRCGVLDHNLNVLGTGRTGYVGVPFDNVGVQYGLEALKKGVLTPSKFADINARIGGLDPVTLQPVPQRTEADPSALAASYRAGYLAIGNTLDQTPILEGRGSNEITAHVTYPSKVLRARLDEQFGNHDNHVLWQGPFPVLGSLGFANRMVLEMDRWVQNVQADERSVPRAQKIREGKPSDLVDQCQLVEGVVVKGDDCPALVRFYPSPSQQAGESVSNDILKCQLKPLRREDYAGIAFSDADWEKLQQAFPTGVCDWTKPGVGEQPTVPWLTFADGPGGKELGDAPRSEAYVPGAGGGAPGGGAPGGAGAGAGAAGAAPAQGTAASRGTGTKARKAKKARVTITRTLLRGGRVRVGCKVTGATLRTCRITVYERRGTRLRKLRTVSVKAGRSAIVRVGGVRRIELRAQATTVAGKRLGASRTLVRSR